MDKEKKKVKITVGLDAHPDSITAAIVVGDKPADAIVDKISDAVAINDMERWFKKSVPCDAVVVLEASGNSFDIFTRLSAIGYRTIVLDSVQVGKVSKSYCNTDKISAVRIAKTYLTGLSDEVWVPDPVTRERREVFSAYQQSVKDCTRHNNRIKSMLNSYTIRLKKQDRNLADEKVRNKIYASRDWSETQKALFEEAFDDLDRAADKRNRMRRIMAAEVLKESKMLQLMRIFGLNVIASYGLIAMIGEPGRFLNPKKLSAYFGLCPKIKQSGNVARLGGISKKGRREIRALLVQAAQTVLRYQSKSNPLYHWAWKVRFKKGRNIAVIAIARKIAVAVWYLLMGKPFKVKENTLTIRRKLIGLAKILGPQQIHSMGFGTYAIFVDHHLNLIELFACKGGHT